MDGDYYTGAGETFPRRRDGVKEPNVYERKPIRTKEQRVLGIENAHLATRIHRQRKRIRELQETIHIMELKTYELQTLLGNVTRKNATLEDQNAKLIGAALARQFGFGK